MSYIVYQDVEALPEDAVRSYLEPLVGTPQAAREFQRWIASLHNRDLIAVVRSGRLGHCAIRSRSREERSGSSGALAIRTRRLRVW
jgi:hypothetical protein